MSVSQAAAGLSEITVRTAGLDDVAGIHEVHRSDVRQWRRLDGTPGEFERLTVLERYLNGGPWMSPESCAAYVNELVLAATPPIIALRGGRVLGEMELLYGHDRDELGKAVCLSILYVHRDARGHGAGHALIDEAVRRGRALGCHVIENTDPETDALPFYMKEEFVLTGEMHTYTATLPASGGPAGWPGTREISPLPALAALRPDVRLVLGRSRHPALIKQMLTHAAGSGRLAIPGTGGLVRAFALTVGEQGYTAFFRGTPLRGNGHATVHVFGPSLTRELIAAVEAVAAAAGYGSIGITVGADEDALVEQSGPFKTHPIWARYL